MGSFMEDLKLVFVNSDESDVRIWSPSSNGVFSFKSIFSILVGNCTLSPHFLAYNIWKFVAPPRVKAFSWISYLSR